MRNRYISITNHFLTKELNDVAANLNLTREASAELMRISLRHCSSLAKGDVGFGVVSLCCFLAFLPIDYAMQILQKYRTMILFVEEKEPLVHRPK
ncbi:MAG: hypothetical protein J6C02_00705 [Peptococcaceae bacterium]|nr:hypothetical protein [Peptococcaceae bacterium]